MKFHSDKPRYFQMQRDNAVESIIPFIEKNILLREGMQVLEIGCAEGGVLSAFVERGLTGVGVEQSRSRTHLAELFLGEAVSSGRVGLNCADIFDEDIHRDFCGRFDLIVLKDVIEHIKNQRELMVLLKDFLRPAGLIFFGFPPWQMPFGGHQQIAETMIAKTPWIHLLPRSLWQGWLRFCGESSDTVGELMEIHDTGISLERFEALAASAGYSTVQEEFFFINPIFRYKFNLKPRRLWKGLAAIPWVRNFWTTSAYYLLGVARETGENEDSAELKSTDELRAVR